MLDVINLALPFFGLIFVGYACGKIKPYPVVGLVWMNFFISYVALPVLFYRIIAKTPLDQLNNVPYVVATSLATFSTFALSVAIGFAARRRMPEATIAGLAGSYGNIGYMGPGLALATLGPEAAVPVALIFCFDNILLFSLTPFLIALASAQRRSIAATALEVVKKIVLHPFIIATVLGIVSAAFHLEPPAALDRLMQFLQNAAAPCALFTLGVTVALRALDRIPWDVTVLAAVKLLLHPFVALIFLSLLGPFTDAWVYTAVLMAALPSALNVFILARQYDAWVEPASSSVLLSTVLATLTTIMYLVKTGTLPVTFFR